MTLEKQIAEDYGIVLKEAQSMGCNKINALYNIPLDNMKAIVNALEEVQKYREIGTVEELQKAEKEEDILKFYYCDSEDSYLVGLRIGNFYYAHYIDGRWVFDMSRHLPWGEHVVDDTTAWKEHTYPSEPKEIDFSSWLQGFIKKECGGTIDECWAAVEKQKEMIAYCDENNCYDCPYHGGSQKENRCMNDFIAEEIVKGGGVNG